MSHKPEPLPVYGIDLDAPNSTNDDPRMLIYQINPHKIVERNLWPSEAVGKCQEMNSKETK